MRLSASQLNVVHYPGHLALVSCPGSGKTRTLVAKLLDVLEEGQESNRLVACITYTNAAVHEIESRLSRSSPSTMAQCEVETIHSFCLKHIVAPHSWHLPRFSAGFSVLVPEDELYIKLVDAVIEKFKLPSRARGDFEQLGRGTGAFPENITKDAADTFWAELDRRSLMDFSSIIYWAAQLVRDVPHIARGLASLFRWMLVDEFQDTTCLQVEILRSIHSHGRTKFFLVGDPHQSIMSFAGARPGLLEQFGKEIGACMSVQLLDNYRSSRNILSLADKLCPRRSPMVAAGACRDQVHVPVWHTVPSMLEGLTNIFLPEVKKQGIELSEVAVLANRWISLLPLARGLREKNIPAIGPGARPYKRSIHLVAPLVEEIAAYVSEPTPRGIGQMRRELRRIVQKITKATKVELGFAGDVCVARLTRAARTLGQLDCAATLFLQRFANVIAEEVHGAGFLSSAESGLVKASGNLMMEDIALHESSHNMRTTTVRDLGLFARGSRSVRLLTMHGSKGREFDAVALVDVFDGHVPFYKAKPGDDIEAEGRRLLYVAITRARKLLMLFTLATPTFKTQASRFLPALFPRGAVRC